MPDPTSNEVLGYGTPGVVNDTLGAVSSAMTRQPPRLAISPNRPTASLEHPEGMSGAITGPLSALSSGLSIYQGVQGLRHPQNNDDRVNAASTLAGGVIGGTSAIATTADALRGAPAAAAPSLLSRVPVSAPPASALSQFATGASMVGSGLEIGTGAYNLTRAIQDRNDRDTSDQASGGIAGLVHGGLGLYATAANNPVAGAAAAGFGAGTMLVNATDAYARQHGTFGADPYARAATRGVHPGQPAAAPQNASGSEDAGTAGAHTYQNTFASSYRLLHHLEGNRGAMADAETIASGAGAASTFGHSIYNAARNTPHAIRQAAGAAIDALPMGAGEAGGASTVSLASEHDPLVQQLHGGAAPTGAGVHTVPTASGSLSYVDPAEERRANAFNAYLAQHPQAH